MAKVRAEPGLFLSAINQSIQEWTELQHVIEAYGSGGRQAKEKLLWMGDVIFDYFKENNLETINEEINEYVGEIVDNEFDFLPLDNSLSEFVSKVIYYHELWSQGLTEKLRALMVERQKSNEAKSKIVELENSAINEALRNMAINNSEPEHQPESKSDKAKDLDEDDGWTLVANKRKNKQK